MKKLPRWFAAFFIGELLVITRKDKRFAAKLAKKKGRDKVKLIATKLFDFNKELVDEASEELQNIDFDEKKQEIIDRSETKYSEIQSRIHTLEDKREHMTWDELTAYMDKLEHLYNKNISKLRKLAEHAEQEFDLEEKWIEIQKHITKLKKKVEEIVLFMNLCFYTFMYLEYVI